jgi:hypothetical protein
MSKFDLDAYKKQHPSQVAVVELAVIEQKDHNGHRLPDAHIVAEDVVNHKGDIIAKKGQMVQHINIATNYEADGQEMLVNAYDEYNAKMLPGEVNDYFLNHGGFRNIKLNQDPEQIHPQMIPDKDLTGTLEFSNAQYDLTIKRSNQYRIIALEDIRKDGDGFLLAKKGEMGAEIFCTDQIAAGITTQDLSEDLYMHNSWINPQSSIEVDNALPTLIDTTVKTTDIKHPAEISNVTLIDSSITNSKIVDVSGLSEPLIIANTTVSGSNIKTEHISKSTITTSEIENSFIILKNQSPEKDATFNVHYSNIFESGMYVQDDGLDINIESHNYKPTYLLGVSTDSSNISIDNTHLSHVMLKDVVDLDTVRIDGPGEGRAVTIENSKLGFLDINTGQTNLTITNTELDNEPNLFEENDFSEIIQDVIRKNHNPNYTINIDSGEMTHGYDKELTVTTPTVQKEQTKEVSGPDF